MSDSPCAPVREDRVRIRVRLQPRARRRACLGTRQGELRLAVTAPPEDGRANRAAAELLAELFGVRPSDVTLVRGPASRSKVFELALSHSAAEARLARLEPGRR